LRRRRDGEAAGKSPPCGAPSVTFVASEGTPSEAKECDKVGV